MTPTGRLEEQDFADVVRELGEQRFSGLLRLERAGDRMTITVENGRLVFASSSNPDHRLGPMLLRSGAITLREMEDAVRAIAPGKRFGTILVERGQLEPKALVQGVVDQTREIILHAFQWTSGSYRLEPGATPAEAITLKISTPQLIFEGITRIESWRRIERGSGGLDGRYAPAPQAEAAFSELTLGVDEVALFRAIKGPRDVESLCAESTLTDLEVCRTLWAFRAIGLVRRVEAAAPLDEDGLEYVLPSDD
jgi:Domain of unknown function (DUF4388)